MRFSAGLSLLVCSVALAALPSHDSPPFMSDVVQTPWGPAHASWPEQMFWEQTDTSRYDEARGSADRCIRAGRVPIASCVRWTGTFVDARPGGKVSTKPGYKEWGLWHLERDSLFVRNDTGGIAKYDAGLIVPMMPLDKADWPEGTENATYGDWQADRLSRLCKAVNLQGFGAADFIEAYPYEYFHTLDYHPRLVDKFERSASISIAGSTTKEKVGFIKEHLFSEYLDFWCEGYAGFYAAMEREIRRRTGREPLMMSQTHYWPSRRRWLGTDHRIILKHVSPQCIFQLVELQGDNIRSLMRPEVTAMTMGLFACREPDFRMGAIMNADHDEFWKAAGHAVPSLSTEERREWGLRYLRRHWIETGFVHVANRDGTVRRACQILQRHYWDQGTIDSSLVALIRSIKPSRPFGPAVYYSVAVERTFERPGKWGGWNILDKVSALRRRNAVGYFVSDVALDNLSPRNRPSGWFVFDRDSMSSAEHIRLEACAPLLDNNETTPAGPIACDDSTMGFGFFDQDDRLVFTVSNIKSSPAQRNCAVLFTGVADGQYRAVDLEDTSKAYPFRIHNQTGSLSVPIERWDTGIFAVPGLDYHTAIASGQTGSPARGSEWNIALKKTWCILKCSTTGNGPLTVGIYSLDGALIESVSVDARKHATGGVITIPLRAPLASGSYVVKIRDVGTGSMITTNR